MTKDELANLAKCISRLAEETLKQLSGKFSPTFAEESLLGLLSRQVVILNDVSVILANNQERYVTSAFILLRSLLDDFLRVLDIHQSADIDTEIVAVQADAHDHRFKAIKESVDINDKYFGGTHTKFFTATKMQQEKQKFLDDASFDKFFDDKNQFKFKKLDSVASLLRNLPNSKESSANVNAYLIYKFLSQYVHFSNLAFYLDFDPNARRLEIQQMEEILFYCYKTVVLCFHHLRQSHSLDWIDPCDVTSFFKGKGSDDRGSAG